jgi:hypothetical protein
MIVIYFDFTDGTEVSYKEGIDKADNFTTNCLDFFSFDTKVDDVVVLRKDGKYISRNKLLLNDGTHTNKEIRKTHNIHKMLVSGSFNFI